MAASDLTSANSSPCSKGCQLSIYQAADGLGEHWRKTVLDDGGIAAADCIIDDFTGDGRPNIVCIGASTSNLKLYENLGKSGNEAAGRLFATG